MLLSGFATAALTYRHPRRLEQYLMLKQFIGALKEKESGQWLLYFLAEAAALHLLGKRTKGEEARHQWA